MSIVTLTTDFGNTDHYTAALKGQLLSVNSNIKIVDITHNINAMDIGQGAYTLEMAYASFPKGTVHLVGVDSNGAPEDHFIAMKLNEHYFVARDNGLLGLIPFDHPPLVVDLQANEKDKRFPARDILALAAGKLASGKELESLGPNFTTYKQFIRPGVKAAKSGITGTVVKIDHYGNVITNIPELDFDILSKDRKYQVVFGREQCTQMNTSYHEVEEGDCYVLFNSSGYLQIGIRNGHAAKLLGLRQDHKITISFED